MLICQRSRNVTTVLCPDLLCSFLRRRSRCWCGILLSIDCSYCTSLGIRLFFCCCYWGFFFFSLCLFAFFAEFFLSCFCFVFLLLLGFVILFRGMCVCVCVRACLSAYVRVCVCVCVLFLCLVALVFFLFNCHSGSFPFFFLPPPPPPPLFLFNTRLSYRVLLYGGTTLTPRSRTLAGCTLLFSPPSCTRNSGRREHRWHELTRYLAAE